MRLIPAPPSMISVGRPDSLATAASIPEVACTVWSNLIDVAHLQAGEVVLLHGGAGGIGTHAIQLAKALGATVAVTAGSAEKLALCADLGADICINYRDEDFVDVLKTQAGGANVILDNMGAKYLERNVNAIAADGRIVIIGMQGGVKAELNIGKLLTKRGTLAATSLRARPAAQKAAICQAVVANVWPMFVDGRIQPIVDTTVAITDVAVAHDRMHASSHSGKIILTIG